jgi:chromosome segregation ATPase
MSKQVLVSRESVFAAADAIKAEGGRVSYRQIARRLGGGSPRDICPLLTEWRAVQVSAPDASSFTEPQLTEVEREFRGGLNRLKDAVRREVSGQFDVERKAIQQRIDEAQRERDESNQDVVDSEIELAELRAQLLLLSGPLAAEQNRSQNLEQQLTTERENRGLAEARETEVRGLVNALQVERETYQSSLERERQAVASLRDRETELLRELECERVERAKAESLGGSLQAQLDSVAARTLQADAEAAAILRETRQEMTSLRDAHEAAASDAVHLRQSVETLQSQFVQLLPLPEGHQASRRKQ